MALTKVSAEAALTPSTIDTADLLYVVDTSATLGKKITVGDFWSGCPGSIDLAAAGTLTIGGSTATAVALGKATAVTGTVTVTSTSASALAVGRQGATSPAFVVDASASTCVTGVKVTARASGAGTSIAATGGGTDEALTIDAKGAGALTVQGTGTGAISLGTATAVASTLTVTSAAAAALAVGRQGATSPGLLVDASTSTCVTGLKVTPAASGAGLALAVTGGATDEALTVNAKGAGLMTLQGTGTGGVVVGTSLKTVSLQLGPAPTDTYSSAMTIDMTKSLHVISAVNGTSATTTLTPSAAGSAGQILTIITETDGTGTVTATFGGSLHSTGTQATTASKFSTIQFISDGTRWLEQCRSTALT